MGKKEYLLTLCLIPEIPSKTDSLGRDLFIRLACRSFPIQTSLGWPQIATVGTCLFPIYFYLQWFGIHFDIFGPGQVQVSENIETTNALT